MSVPKPKATSASSRQPFSTECGMNRCSLAAVLVTSEAYHLDNGHRAFQRGIARAHTSPSYRRQAAPRSCVARADSRPGAACVRHVCVSDADCGRTCDSNSLRRYLLIVVLHPEVAAAVARGEYRSGLEHYLIEGRAKACMRPTHEQRADRHVARERRCKCDTCTTPALPEHMPEPISPRAGARVPPY